MANLSAATRSGPSGASFATRCSPARLAVLLVLISCAVLVAITFDAEKIESLLVWVQENKSQGSVLFLVLYTSGVVLMLPAMVMAMASGAIFGLVGGVLLAWIGSSIGQVIAFIIGRYLLRDIVLEYLTAQFPKWTAIDKAMLTDGWKLVTLLRLSPIAPWNVLNYALSVTSIPLSSYTITSSLSILPYLILFVYFGSMARSLADIFTGTAGLDTRSTIIMGIVSGAAIVGVVWYTTHVSRQAMNSALRQHAEELPAELTGDEDVVTLLGGSDPTSSLSPRAGTAALSSYTPESAVSLQIEMTTATTTSGSGINNTSIIHTHQPKTANPGVNNSNNGGINHSSRPDIVVEHTDEVAALIGKSMNRLAVRNGRSDSGHSTPKEGVVVHSPSFTGMVATARRSMPAF